MKTEILNFTSSSSSSGPSTLPPEWPNCQRVPLLSSFSLHLCKIECVKSQRLLLTEVFHRNIYFSPTWTLLSSPVHDLTELLSGQEARVLPDLPQSALELLLVFVLQSLLLFLLSGAATLLSIVQPDTYQKSKLDNSRRCTTNTLEFLISASGWHN